LPPPKLPQNQIPVPSGTLKIAFQEVKQMIFSVDTWLLPAIAASSSSYLVCLAWERIRNRTAPGGLLSAFLAGLSFLMGAISSYYRHRLLAPSFENNVIVMFVVGASTTYLWLLLRKYLPGLGRRKH
jgi:hypothetical protein